jgi:hypothetical protein
MGRNPKPAALLEFSPGYNKNPARKRARAKEPKIKPGLGDPPAEWVAGAEHNARFTGLLIAWKEIVEQDVCHVLNRSHRDLVEVACHLKYKIRRASAGYGRSTSGDFAQLTTVLGKMGMTPVDSARVAGSVTLPGQGPGSETTGARDWGELVG